MVKIEIKIKGYYCEGRNIVNNDLHFENPDRELITMKFPKFVFNCGNHGEMSFKGFNDLTCEQCGKKVNLNVEIY